MTKATLGVFLLAAGAVSGTAFAGSHAANDEDAVPMVLTGCVVPARGDHKYFVKDVSVRGPSIAPASAFFRFDDDDTENLGPFVGHRVEIWGTADLDDPDDAEITMEIDRGIATTSIRSDGDRVRMDSPVWAGAITDVHLEADVPSFEFDIESVRVIAGECRR